MTPVVRDGLRRYDSSGSHAPRGNWRPDALRRVCRGTQSVPPCVPTRSVGTRSQLRGVPTGDTPLALVVQKFGGTSVATADRLIAAARRAIRAHQAGNQV